MINARSGIEKTTGDGRVVIGDVVLSFTGNGLDEIAKKQTDAYYKSYHGTNKLGGHVGELAVATSSAMQKFDVEGKRTAEEAKEAKDKATVAKEVAEAAKNAAEAIKVVTEKETAVLSATKLNKVDFAQLIGREEQIHEQVREIKQACSTHGQEIASLKAQVTDLKEVTREELKYLKEVIRKELKTLRCDLKETDKTVQKLAGQTQLVGQTQVLFPQTMVRPRALNRTHSINENIEDRLDYNWHTKPPASSKVKYSETPVGIEILNESIRSTSRASTINDGDEKIADNCQAPSEADTSETASSFDVLEESPKPSTTEEVRLEPVLTQSFLSAGS